MPKINDLTTRPGGPQPTDEFWLASAGAAADFKSTIAALTGAVLGNISVTENANGVSVVVPGKFQVCWAYLTLPSLAFGETVDYVWTFPTPFPGSSPLPIVIPVASMTSNFHRNASPSSASGDWTRESIKLFVQDHRTAGSAVANRVMVVAFSRL